jgi:hypothetical protein
MLKAISLTNKALALFKAAWLWLTHYKVCILWGGLPAPDWRTTHYAKTFGEALEIAEGFCHCRKVLSGYGWHIELPLCRAHGMEKREGETYRSEVTPVDRGFIDKSKFKRLQFPAFFPAVSRYKPQQLY